MDQALPRVMIAGTGSGCGKTTVTCAVLKALDDHLIAPSRYQSYLSMLEDKDQGKYREGYS